MQHDVVSSDIASQHYTTSPRTTIRGRRNEGLLAFYRSLPTTLISECAAQRARSQRKNTSSCILTLFDAQTIPTEV